MEFRKAFKSDIEDICRGKKYAYAFPDEYLNNYMQQLFMPDKCIVCEENGGISAYAQSNDYGIISRGAQITARYISDVYTMPSKRRMGYMKNCVKSLLTNLHNELVPFAFCVPFDYKVFDSLGFRLVSDIKEYRITADDIPAYRMSGSINMVYNPDESMINRISDVYDSYMKRTGRGRFYAMRTNIYWQSMISDFISSYGGNFAVFYDSDSNISGYMLYTLEKDILNVFEYAYKNIQTYRAILAFMKNHKYQIKEIIIKAAEDDIAYLDFAGNNNTIKLMPFAMAKITNTAEVLKTLCKDLNGITVKVFDPMIEANSGVWAISESGIMPSSDMYDFETDTGTLTQLYLGYISAADALYMGYIRNASGNTEKEQTLKAVFTKQNNYINMLL